MPDILPVILRLQTVLPKTTCRQLAHIVGAVLTMTGSAELTVEARAMTIRSPARMFRR